MVHPLFLEFRLQSRVGFKTCYDHTGRSLNSCLAHERWYTKHHLVWWRFHNVNGINIRGWVEGIHVLNYVAPHQQFRYATSTNGIWFDQVRWDINSSCRCWHFTVGRCDYVCGCNGFFFVKRRCRSENLGSHRMPHLTITFHDQHQFSEDPVVIISHQKIWP